MGASFTNVQVHIAKLDGKRAMRDVLAMLRALASEDGFVEASGPGPADRTILVEADDEWISVYDEATETQEQERLDRLAAVVSGRTGTHAVAVLVHDSNMLELRLFHRGKLVDRYNSCPDWFAPATDEEIRAAAGRPAQWAPVLAPGHDAVELEAAWREKRRFCEETLATIASLLDLDPARACDGFRGIDANTGDYEVLRFRHAVRPAHETPAVGTPRFQDDSGWGGPSRIARGHPFQIVRSVNNVGGRSQGVSIVVFGPALDRGLVTVDTMELVMPGNLRITEPFADHRFPDGTDGKVARFPDVVIPAGFADTTDVPPEDWMKVMFGARLQANIVARGATLGEGRLGVAFLPVEGNGHFVHKIDVLVEPGPRRPLRASRVAEVHEAQKLEQGETLFMLASMDLAPAAAAKAVAPIVREWGALFDGNARLSLMVDHGVEKRLSDTRAKELFADAQWSRVQDELATAELVYA